MSFCSHAQAALLQRFQTSAGGPCGLCLPADGSVMEPEPATWPKDAKADRWLLVCHGQSLIVFKLASIRIVWPNELISWFKNPPPRNVYISGICITIVIQMQY